MEKQPEPVQTEFSCVNPRGGRRMLVIPVPRRSSIKKWTCIAAVAAALLADGRSMYARTSTAAQADRSLSIVLAIDTGSSIHLDMEHVREGLRQFVNRVEPGERVSICSFGARLRCAPFTRDQQTMLEDVSALAPHDDARVFDSIDGAIDRVRPVDGRRVVIVFAMKPDWRSSTSPKRVLNDAQTAGVTVYAVNLDVRYYDGDDFIDGRPDPELEHLVRESGGAFFEATGGPDLAGAFDRLAEQLLQPRGTRDRQREVARTTARALQPTGSSVR